MKQPNVEAAIAYALHRLAVELSPQLTYHSLEHTRDEVLVAAVQFARAAGIDEQQMDLLLVAAAFHDLGFIERSANHEVCSARIAAQVLPAFAFDGLAIEQIMSIVLATRLPQSPRNYLEELMCDADLSGLGSDEFLARSEALLRERRAFGEEFTKAAWWEDQIDFLVRHHYWSKVAEDSRGPGKATNLLRLHQKLAAAKREEAAAKE